MSEYDDVLTACAREIGRALADIGVEHQHRDVVVENIITNIRVKWGGERHYVHVEGKRKRNQEIIGIWQFGERDRNKIAREVGCSRSTVDRVIAIHLQRLTPEYGLGSEDWNI